MLVKSTTCDLWFRSTDCFCPRESWLLHGHWGTIASKKQLILNSIKERDEQFLATKTFVDKIFKLPILQKNLYFGSLIICGIRCYFGVLKLKSYLYTCIHLFVAGRRPFSPLSCWMVWPWLYRQWVRFDRCEQPGWLWVLGWPGEHWQFHPRHPRHLQHQVRRRGPAFRSVWQTGRRGEIQVLLSRGGTPGPWADRVRSRCLLTWQSM